MNLFTPTLEQPGIAVMCEACGITYHVVRLRPDRPGQNLCAVCRSRKALRACQAQFVTPDSDKAQRVRANGLINRRRKLGWFTVPLTCGKCGHRARVDSHHPDYAKPAQIVWLCRGCHGKAHRQPRFLEGVPVIDTDQFRPAVRPMPRGDKANNVKLTDANVREIRERYAAGGVSQKFLATEYGVGESTVWAVIKNPEWRNGGVT